MGLASNASYNGSAPSFPHWTCFWAANSSDQLYEGGLLLYQPAAQHGSLVLGCTLCIAVLWWLVLIIAFSNWTAVYPTEGQLETFYNLLRAHVEKTTSSTLDPLNLISEKFVDWLGKLLARVIPRTQVDSTAWYSIPDIQATLSLGVLQVFLISFFAAASIWVGGCCMTQVAVRLVIFVVTAMLLVHAACCLIGTSFAFSFFPWARQFIAKDTVKVTFWTCLGIVSTLMGLSFAPIFWLLDPHEPNNFGTWRLMIANMIATLLTFTFSMLLLIKTRLRMADDSWKISRLQGVDKIRSARDPWQRLVNVVATIAFFPIIPASECLSGSNPSSITPLFVILSTLSVILAGALALSWLQEHLRNNNIDHAVSMRSWVLLFMLYFFETTTMALCGWLTNACEAKLRLAFIILSGVMSITVNTLICRALVDSCCMTGKKRSD